MLITSRSVHAKSRQKNRRSAPWRLLTTVLTLAAGAITPAGSATTVPGDPLLTPPVVNLRPGPEYQDDTRAGAMIIGMDQTPKGRIWGCWTGTGDNTESYFILATSDDGGATWSKPRVVIDPAEIFGLPPRSALIGNLWTDPTGRLWLFFDQHLRGHTTTNWYITCDNPDGDRPVWSQPVYFADGSTLNKPTVLGSGEWLLPVSLLTHGRSDARQLADPSRRPGADVFASLDRGKTWRRRGGVVIPEADVNHNEHMIVELRDGRLWMLLRTRYGIAETHSPDGGRTWTEPRPSPIQNPSTRFFLRRLASGRLLLVKNGPIGERTPARSHLTAFLSDNDGATWGRGLLLDDRRSLSYPDGFQSPDGLIHILYDWNRHTDAEILLATFREDDVLAGRPASRDTRLRHVVDKARTPHLAESITPDRKWTAQATADAKLDVSGVISDATVARPPVGDTLLREAPDGSWILAFSPGRGPESDLLGATHLTRSTDQGRSWSTAVPIDFGPPRDNAPTEAGVGEIILHPQRAILLFSSFAQPWTTAWQSWHRQGDAALRKWNDPVSLPGRLAGRSFVRNALVTRDGRILVPFQHFAASDEDLSDPRCGVLASRDGGATWAEHGNMRLTPVQRMFGWTESNLVELGDGRVVMLVRQSGLMGLLYFAESRDGGRTWPPVATLKRAPHPGTATHFSVGGDTVAMIHNPGNKLALWISFDGMKSWPYQRLLARTNCVGPKENMRHPHGFVSADRMWLNFAYVDRDGRAAHYSARLPVTP